MALRDGERQVSPAIDGIRADHVARYRWALQQIPSRSRVLDVACGVGYGARILADAGHRVVAVDREPSAIEYAKAHYAHPNISFLCEDACRLPQLGIFNAAISFETIEHLEHPLLLLQYASRCTDVLLASVPNEDVFPHRGVKHHRRHYTADQFDDLLSAAGFSVSGWFGQAGPQSEVEPDINGRTLVAVAKRSGAAVAKTTTKPNRRVAEKRERVTVPPASASASPPKTVPATVAILGMGPSLNTFIDIVKCLGGTHKLCDEVWGINALGDVLRCDKIFHMDNVAVQLLRAEANPDGNIAAMVDWMRKHPGPIFTSRLHPEFPGFVEYPLADVLNSCMGQRYFNSTAAYAIAYAVHIGVRKIILGGIDFSYANSHDAERGRACCEYWLGIARARGIDIAVMKTSTLLDACSPPDERLYGYDGVRVDISGPLGSERVSFSERPLPTAEEIEDRYDHSRPTIPEHLLGR